MKTIQLNVDALEVRSFATTRDEAQQTAADSYLTSAVSETDGMVQCKSCGPCCQ